LSGRPFEPKRSLGWFKTPKWYTPSNPMRWIVFPAVILLPACNTDKIAQLEKQNKELVAKLDAVSKKTSMDLQERCAKQARTHGDYKLGSFRKG